MVNGGTSVEAGELFYARCTCSIWAKPRRIDRIHKEAYHGINIFLVQDPPTICWLTGEYPSVPMEVERRNEKDKPLVLRSDMASG